MLSPIAAPRPLFMNEMLARGTLVILSPWLQDFGRKLMGAGLLSCVKRHLRRANLMVLGTLR